MAVIGALSPKTAITPTTSVLVFALATTVLTNIMYLGVVVAADFLCALFQNEAQRLYLQSLALAFVATWFTALRCHAHAIVHLTGPLLRPDGLATDMAALLSRLCRSASHRIVFLTTAFLFYCCPIKLFAAKQN